MNANNAALQQGIEQQMKENNAVLRHEMKEENAAFRQEMKEENSAFRQEMKEENAALRQEMNANNAALQQEMSTGLEAIRQEMKKGNVVLQQGINANSSAMIQLSIQTARHINRFLRGHETIFPVPNNQGNPPPKDLFPRCDNEISDLLMPRVEALLQFYEISFSRGAKSNDKKALLRAHLGIVSQLEF
jgi:hypothetical protein